jgi:DNA-binding response OmpR family regulator
MIRPTATHASLGRILIVEDDGLIALELAEALQSAGAEEVSMCASSDDALLELARMRPDVLVLDVQLADRDDGWALAELAVQLSIDPPLILFTTGNPASIPHATAMLGHVLAKPFPPRDLVQFARLHRQRPGLFARLRAALPRKNQMP